MSLRSQLRHPKARLFLLTGSVGLTKLILPSSANSVPLLSPTLLNATWWQQLLSLQLSAGSYP